MNLCERKAKWFLSCHSWFWSLPRDRRYPHLSEVPAWIAAALIVPNSPPPNCRVVPFVFPFISAGDLVMMLMTPSKALNP